MIGGAPTPVDDAIEARIVASKAMGLGPTSAPGRPLVETRYVIKYTGAKYGGSYPPSPNAVAAPGLFISPNPGFTWGDGIYCCPIAYPISGAIYGRCGIVAELPDTSTWRIFDATDPTAANLYIAWIQRQPMYSMLTLTAHANLANQLLRNLFRTRFHIDVVVFHPDEYNKTYTRPHHDRWLAISEWTPTNRLAAGVPATRPIQPQLTVILAEEFKTKQSGIRRATLIGPTPTLPSMMPSAADIIAAYRAKYFLWVGA